MIEASYLQSINDDCRILAYSAQRVPGVEEYTVPG